MFHYSTTRYEKNKKVRVADANVKHGQSLLLQYTFKIDSNWCETTNYRGQSRRWGQRIRFFG